MSRPDHPLLGRVVFDTNQLGDPPQRRLHMSTLDNGERPLLVLNANLGELEGNVMASERRRWTRELTRKGLRPGDPARLRILAAAREAARGWLRQELDDPGSMLARNPLTGEEKDQVECLSDALPDQFFRVFRGQALANIEADKKMVAEAAVTRRRLLVSENEGTIDHHPLNAWLKQEGFSQAAALLATTAQAHRAFNDLMGPRSVCEWMLGAYLPERPSAEDEDIVRRNIRQIQRAGLAETAKMILEALDSDPDLQGAFARVRQSLPVRARATEARRLDTVRGAAREAGWEPEGPAGGEPPAFH